MTTITRLLRRSLVVLGTGLLAACSDAASFGPNVIEPAAELAAAGQRTADLGSCDSLAVPAGSRLQLHVYAEGVEIYRWTGSSWGFVGPSASLSADAAGRSTIGTHYGSPGGPVWESNAGGKVVGAVQKRCPSESGAIPWLLLGATPDGGPGIFHRGAYIQRRDTVGGVAPAQGGTFVREEAHVPYTTEYFFYRGR